MAQTKKKTATKSACKGAGAKTHKKACGKQEQKASNMFFVISMSVLAATLLFADLIMII